MVSRVVLDLTSADSIKQAKDRIGSMYHYYRDRKSFLEDMRSRLRRKYVKKMLRELKEVPDKREYPDDYPIEFTSDKQRRFVMSKLNGKPYVRTNKIVNSWSVKFKNERGKLTLQVKNKAPEHIYVVGKVGFGVSRRSLRRYKRPIQQFHVKTGWQPAYEIIQKYQQKMEEEADDIIEEWLQEGFK